MFACVLPGSRRVRSRGLQWMYAAASTVAIALSETNRACRPSPSPTWMNLHVPTDSHRYSGPVQPSSAELPEKDGRAACAQPAPHHSLSRTAVVRLVSAAISTAWLPCLSKPRLLPFDRRGSAVIRSRAREDGWSTPAPAAAFVPWSGLFYLSSQRDVSSA